MSIQLTDSQMARNCLSQQSIKEENFLKKILRVYAQSCRL